jgi:DNA polymerase III sliding clamp (beta) subunit (PCNA family)
MNRRPIEQAQDRDLRLSRQALERAAKRAYSLAAETGTSVIVLSNGILEEIHPDAATALLQEPSTPYRREK